MMNPHLNVTKLYEEFEQLAVRLGFQQSEVNGTKTVQLVFSSPEWGGQIVYRIPFLADDSERITLLVHQSEFSGEWPGYEGIPVSIREEAHRKLCELVGVPYEPFTIEEGQEANAGKKSGRDGAGKLDTSGTVNGIMAADEDDLVRLGKEMKAMKTNTELGQEGMIPDPIQH